VLHGKDCPRLDRGLEGSGNGWKTSNRSNSEGATGLCDFSCAQDVVRRAALRLFLRLDSIPFSADAGGGCLHENGTKRNCAVEGEIPDSILKRPMIPALERSRRERTRPPAPPSTPSTLGEVSDTCSRRNLQRRLSAREGRPRRDHLALFVRISRGRTLTDRWPNCPVCGLSGRALLFEATSTAIPIIRHEQYRILRTANFS
jgi:hypothetical protein